MPRSVCSCSVASRSDACHTPALEIISRSPSSSVVMRMMSGLTPHNSPLRRCSTCAASTSCAASRLQPRPRQRARRLHQLAQARALDEVGDEVDQPALFAVVAHLDDRRMRDLQRLRLAQEARARPLPVALAVAPQQADRHRVPHRAVHPSIDFAAEAAGAQPLAELVRRRAGPKPRRHRAIAGRALAFRRAQRPAELGDVAPAVVRILRERAADRHVQPRRQVGPQRRRPRHRRRSDGRSAPSTDRRPDTARVRSASRTRRRRGCRCPTARRRPPPTAARARRRRSCR